MTEQQIKIFVETELWSLLEDVKVRGKNKKEIIQNQKKEIQLFCAKYECDEKLVMQKLSEIKKLRDGEDEIYL